MGRTLGRTLIVLSLLIWSARLATAADSIELSNRGLEVQRSGDSRQAIDLYSRALAKGDLPDNFLAALYNNRAAAYTKEGEYALALQDYEKSLDLEPESIPVLNNRGALYAKMGHFTRAIVDYSECLMLDPDFGKGYSNRGNAQFYLRRFDKAIEDYLKALQFDTSDRYRTVIWLYLARARLGIDGRAELRANLRTLPKNEWPAPVAMMYLGAYTPDQMLVSAVSDDPRRDRERKTEALFYRGYQALLSGDSRSAMADFRRTVQSQVQYLVEVTGARAELGLTPVAQVAQPSKGQPQAPGPVSATPEAPPVENAPESAMAPAMAAAPPPTDNGGQSSESLDAILALSKAKQASTPVLIEPSQVDQSRSGASSSSGESAAAANPAPVAKGTVEISRAEETDKLLIHLASLKSESSAEKSAARFRQDFSDLMGSAALKIRRVDLGGEGVVYRIVAGPYATRASAQAFCQEVHKRSQSQYCQLLTY